MKAQSGTESQVVSDSSPTVPQVKRDYTVFRLEAPTANTVELAADFTLWASKPLSLRKHEDGVWQIRVLLPPGRHTYRYLVDEEWRDDPRCTKCEPNPFGGINAVVEIN